MVVAKAKNQARASDRRVNAIAIKESPEYKGWLDGLVDETQIPLAAIVRSALEDWAEKRGLPAPPKGLSRRRGGGA